MDKIEIIPKEEIEANREKMRKTEIERIQKEAIDKWNRRFPEISKLAPWIKDQIEKSPDGQIRMLLSDFYKRVVGLYEKLIKETPEVSVYWASKYVLFSHGIYVYTGEDLKGKKLLIMRKITPEDRLPDII